MSLIIILIAYYLDYKQDKKRYIQDLKAGLFFLIILLSYFLIILYVLDLGILYAIFGVGGVVFPGMLFLKTIKK